MESSQDMQGIVWAVGRMLPEFQAPDSLLVCDMRGASRGVQLSVTSVVGLLNRPKPRAYMIGNEGDAFWLRELLPNVPQEVATFGKDDTLTGLLDGYAGCVQGMIVYDPGCIESVNIATTMAGQREGVIVSPEQVVALRERYGLPVLADLREYGWKSRLEAYAWAERHLLAGASKRLLAGMDPTIVGSMRSYLVATRCFVYYLDARKYLPDRHNSWRSERGLMKRILKAYPAGGVHLGWFIDEPSGVNLTSGAAMAVLASDFCSNLEVWSSVQPATPLKQRPLSAAVEPDSSKVYVAFTISDGDNVQYNQGHMRQLWLDPERGSVPIGWTISPLLQEVAPCIAAYYARTATENDELIAGPSGAGYMFPSRWPTEHLSAFLEHSGRSMQSMGLTTLEVLDSDLVQRSGIAGISAVGLTRMGFRKRGLQRRFAQELQPYGVHGILSGAGKLRPRWTIGEEGIAMYHNLGLAGSVDGTVRLIKLAASFRRRPLFLNVYVLAWKMKPTDLQQVMRKLGKDFEVVLPGTLLAMLAKAKR